MYHHNSLSSIHMNMHLDTILNVWFVDNYVRSTHARQGIHCCVVGGSWFVCCLGHTPGSGHVRRISCGTFPEQILAALVLLPFSMYVLTCVQANCVFWLCCRHWPCVWHLDRFTLVLMRACFIPWAFVTMGACMFVRDTCTACADYQRDRAARVRMNIHSRSHVYIYVCNAKQFWVFVLDLLPMHCGS